ncbi:pancreatic triacylglycerol lipase-like [Melitaea cinxia]|uniref:pancreatic triacylglycerol lipase-like n=1 Tax=Melitaea cinxia TaxID=113334 RepID=UPI001E27386D|nr:pancreatic triacylglycerol lipase-like [Melitaea cinxia]
MRVLVAILVYVALCAGNAIPSIPKDNSHYVEGESRYIWMPDGKGELHFVDLQEKEDWSTFNATRNAAATQFWLFTRQNRNSRQLLVHNNANSVRNSNYRGNRPTNVIVHGWRQNGGDRMNIDITSALLDLGDFNVIVIDWRGVAGGSYSSAANQVPAIGNHVGNFIQWIFNNFGGNFNQLHLIGFSLGAHIVGNAGRALGGRPARVTGLDPAGPSWRSNSNRLSTRAGRYVEAIHTDGNVLGIFIPVGHADFYPNGGQHFQPGCSDNTCSHGRSHQFFASSVRTNHFVGVLCRNHNEANLGTCNSNTQFRMGNGNFGKRGSGIYALRTGSSWPF